MRLVLAFAAVSLIAAPAIAANPKQCRDAKGHFTPCHPVLTVKAAPGSNDVTKDKNGKCHWKAGPKKGQFVTCPR